MVDREPQETAESCLVVDRESLVTAENCLVVDRESLVGHLLVEK